MIQDVRRMLKRYEIGSVKKVSPISSGLIHQTYQIRSAKGRFVFQRLHPVLASEGIGKDFLAVTRYLEEHGFLAPQAVLSKDGKVLVKDGKWKWRMQTYIPGETHHRAHKPAMARQAGNIYARFHKVMDGCDYAFKSTKLLHETEKLYDEFLATAEGFASSELMPDAAQEVDFVKRELPKLFLPETLPLRIIHGDPKISNILFDKNGKAEALVDLDTCNRRPLLVELGDAFRSWCGVEEDDPRNRFHLPMFRAAWKGYADGAQGFMTARERKLVPKAIGTITLELASRFLTDYFQDAYFGWDSSRYASRRDHNLARARGQISLYTDLQNKLPKVRAALDS